MARVSNPLIGKSRNKIGSVVFTNWKGINVLKEKPATVANPNTDNQIMRRSAFTQIIAIARLIYAAIVIGFKEQAVQKSEVNAFTGYNLTNAFDYSSPPVATFDETQLLVSQGTITLTPINSMVADNSLGTVVINFPNTSSAPGQSASDKAVVVLRNNTTSQWQAFVTSAVRSAGTVSVTPTNFALGIGNDIQCYLFFRNDATGKTSDSFTDNTAVVA